MIGKNEMILAKDRYYSLNCYETKRNNNVLVVGTSGAGKTRSIVIPNLLQATGSYIVSDPKGNLYGKYKDYLKSKGYVVKCIDFVNAKGVNHYNPFNYIHSERDIIKMAHMLVGIRDAQSTADPYWEQSSEVLVSALLAYLHYHRGEDDHTLNALMKLVNACALGGSKGEFFENTAMDRIMDEAKKRVPHSFACTQYDKARLAPARTFASTLTTVQAKLGLLDCDTVRELTKKDDINIASIGRRKTALFVCVSDNDRSLDSLANLFFTQAMNELCLYADQKCKDNRLPVDVRFILDDFATNCVIGDFPRMIASIRSRGISTMLMIQAESQLMNTYNNDGRTIIGNCDTYVYLGGNDIDTATSVSERSNMPLDKILNMPVETNWIFRRGEKPVYGSNFDLGAMEAELYPPLR